jgi:hypothetical protein
MLKPRTPPNIVKVTEKINPKTSARLLSKPANLEKTVPVANVARETRTVSQPTKTRYERNGSIERSEEGEGELRHRLKKKREKSMKLILW